MAEVPLVLLTDELPEGTEKINQGIKKSYEALNKVITVDTKIDDTQKQLDAVALKSRNMFNKVTITPNTWIDGNNGKPFTLSNYFTSDFISVTENTQYAINPVANDTRIAFYNNSKTYISKATDGVITFTTPPGTTYVRIGSKSNLLNSTQLEIGSTSTPYEPYGAQIQYNSFKDNSFPVSKLKKNSIGYEQLSITPVIGDKSRNIFDKTAITTNNYLNNQTGIPFTLNNYFVSDFIPVTENNQYVINPIATDTRSCFYNSSKNFISATADNLSNFTTPPGTVYVRIASRNGLLDTTQLEAGIVSTPYESYGVQLKKEALSPFNIKPATIYTFNDAWTEWLKGNKFPISFYGDSTVDGANTTGFKLNTLGVDSTNINAFSKKLEELLRDVTNNSILRIYNAGFSGQKSDWGLTNINSAFGGTSAYNDVKMIGIGFGINDRLSYQNEKDYRTGFRNNIIGIIDWCYSKKIQPFLITTQATVEPGIQTNYAGTYPLRTSEHINSIANQVKKDLAREYGLELIDLNKFTEMFLMYSSVPTKTIISDRLHFGDIGHRYEADVLFRHLSPRTIIVDDYTKIDYSSQRIKDSVPEDWLTFPTSPSDSFKVYVNYTKADSSDMKIMTVWIFNSAKKKLSLKAYRNDSTLAYVKVNGVPTILNNAETVIGQLELGLHKLEVFTGATTQVDFKGFILE
ncbi:SGNH/GDSL hydrolase family protein [Bacillus sp. CH_70]|uniref:SGNH/GDSL hydrolase family protein n=1 Tax=Bacillus sp. CH_70 TaxID=2978215 RepID=UPI0030F5800D